MLTGYAIDPGLMMRHAPIWEILGNAAPADQPEVTDDWFVFRHDPEFVVRLRDYHPGQASKVFRAPTVETLLWLSQSRDTSGQEVDEHNEDNAESREIPLQYPALP